MSAYRFIDALRGTSQAFILFSEPRSRMFAHNVVAAIAEKHGFTKAQLLGKSRVRSLVDARSEAAKALRAKGLSLPRIGQLLGGRDHTTILNLLRREGDL